MDGVVLLAFIGLVVFAALNVGAPQQYHPPVIVVQTEAPQPVFNMGCLLPLIVLGGLMVLLIGGR